MTSTVFATKRFARFEDFDSAFKALVDERGALNNQVRVAFETAISLKQIDGFRSDIRYGTFDNCREYGITYAVGEFAFCVFEHRNSDQIYVQGSRLDLAEPFGPYTGEHKNDSLGSFEAENYYGAAQRLNDLLDAAWDSPLGASVGHVVATAEGLGRRY